MRVLFSILMLVLSLNLFSQEKEITDKPKSLIKTQAQRAKEKAQKAPITSYKIFSIERDTVVLDTTLSIKKEYEFNYLHKDLFGLMPFPNEGQTYTTLDFGLAKFTPFPEFGYKAKHMNYIEANDINYYSVATPLTELYYKSVMEQGQNVDALITLNTSKNFNFSVAFKGLRSLGKYINQLSSTGNFRFTASYNTKDNRYGFNFHFTGQDLLNGENGGLTQPEYFEDNDPLYENRPRLQVFLIDAKSFLKGKRVFIDQLFRINSKDQQNNLLIANQLNYEHKVFEYNQATVSSTIGITGSAFNRFGAASVNSYINDQTIYDKLYNKIGAIYENKSLGKFQFFVENYIFKSFTGIDKTIGNTMIPGQIQAVINTLGGQYDYRKNNFNGTVVLSNSISTQPLRNLDAKLTYTINPKNNLSFQYQNISKSPNNNYILNQSSYENYNWYNSFKNEKINSLTVNASTQWVNASVQFTNLNDHLFFQDIKNQVNQQLVTPQQYSGSINYVSFKIAREFKYKKWGLDNTFLYQKVAQNDTILNLPQITLRNSLYYSDYVFKRAMFLQTGITINYFSKYYANDYNPILGEFFVQNDKQIGDFPMLDFFVNARVKQTRIFLKAEHFNSGMSGNKFYSAPDLPFHDFMIRFGLVWNFFQ
jgi:hypothetical protein